MQYRSQSFYRFFSLFFRFFSFFPFFSFSSSKPRIIHLLDGINRQKTTLASVVFKTFWEWSEMLGGADANHFPWNADGKIGCNPPKLLLKLLLVKIVFHANHSVVTLLAVLVLPVLGIPFRLLSRFEVEEGWKCCRIPSTSKQRSWTIWLRLLFQVVDFVLSHSLFLHFSTNLLM